MRFAYIIASAALVLAAGGAASAAPSDAELIKSAMSAAPASISANATVAVFNEKGEMRTLRKGTNGWVCTPDDPMTPGNDPVCGDANGMLWVQAWAGHTTPPADKPGLAYMLQGGSDASNLDPYMMKPADGKTWVVTGPHIMILSADAAKASGYPSGEANPDTSKPYVMFGGTPYAHIMMPVK
jgi:hypothetical protein